MADAELLDAQCRTIASLVAHVVRDCDSARKDAAIESLRRNLEKEDPSGEALAVLVAVVDRPSPDGAAATDDEEENEEEAEDEEEAAPAPAPAPPPSTPPPPPPPPAAPSPTAKEDNPVGRLLTDSKEKRGLVRTSSLSALSSAANMQRASYSPVDLAHLLRNKSQELPRDMVDVRYLERLDTNGDGLVQAEEMGAIELVVLGEVRHLIRRQVRRRARHRRRLVRAPVAVRRRRRGGLLLGLRRLHALVRRHRGLERRSARGSTTAARTTCAIVGAAPQQPVAKADRERAEMGSPRRAIRQPQHDGPTGSQRVESQASAGHMRGGGGARIAYGETKTSSPLEPSARWYSRKSLPF